MELSKTADTTTGNSAFGNLVAMFYEPTQAFTRLEPRRHAWLPMVLTILSSCILLMWYFSVVDFAWFSDQMGAGIKDPAARERAAQMMSRGMVRGMGLGGAIIGLPLITAIIGMYLMLAAKLVSKDFTFGKGFALSAWSSVPTLLVLPLGAVQILMSPNGQMGSSELNPLSVNQLFFHYGMTHPLTGPLDMLNLTTIWGIALMVIGFQVWAKVSRATALKVVVIPYVVVFGAWLAIGLSRVA